MPTASATGCWRPCASTRRSACTNRAGKPRPANGHLAYFLALAEKARPELAGPAQGAWLARLDLERENFLAAHAWAGQSREGAGPGLGLAWALKPYWINRGLLDLGLRLTVEALARPGAEGRTHARCRGLFDAGQIGTYMGRYAEAQGYLEESLAIAREIGDKRGRHGRRSSLSGWPASGRETRPPRARTCRRRS